TNLWGTRCGALCARDVIAKGGVGAPIINAGQMLTLRRRGCLALWQPLRQMANPQRGKTTNRRAGCGRTACPVRREGGPKPISSSYPYQAWFQSIRLSPSLRERFNDTRPPVVQRVARNVRWTQAIPRAYPIP